MDPFVDNPPKSNSTKQDNTGFLCDPNPTREVLGQITAYATAILSAQYRTHLFMVLIVGEYARLIRWDRGGAVVTKRIEFNEVSHLFDFLVWYNGASSEDRGHDSTVSSPSEDEIERAKGIIPEFTNAAEAYLAVTMSSDLGPRRFIIPRPEVRPDAPIGRWTRSSIAYDVKDGRRVYLKDSWRVLQHDLQPEGEIYDRLRENNVPNIPPCVVAGDVDNDGTHHASRTHEIVAEYFKHHSRRITSHRHYRIVLGVVGRKLEKFDRTWEVVNAMHAALKGQMTILLAVGLCI